MQMRRFFLFMALSGLLGTQFQASGKIFLDKSTRQDSVMMIIREYKKVDTVPYQQAYEKEVEELRRQWREMSNYEKIAKQFLSENSSIQTPEQKKFMEMILENVKTKSNTEKDAKDIEKKLSKGKLSNKAKPYINDLYTKVRKNKVNIQETIYKLEDLNESDGVVACMRSCFPNKEIVTRMISIKDTIIYQSWRPAMYLNSSKEQIASYDNKEVSKGWEWAMSEDNQKKSENFPEPITYYFSNSHPQYRILDKGYGNNKNWTLFDNKGNLVGVANFMPNDELTEDQEFEQLILAHAYKKNELNIQGYGDHTKHYVKVKSGLENLTAKEKAAQERATSALADAFVSSMKADMRYGRHSKKAKSVGRKSAAKAVGALFSNSGFHDDLGSRWVNEMKGKYKSRVLNPYKTYRIDNTTFRSVYVDNDGKGLFEIITKFQSDGPYKFKKVYTINSLADKNYFNPEEVKKYNKLLGNKK